MLYTDNRTTIRFANETDVPQILSFIKDLAEYEGLLDKVEATEEIIFQAIFQNKSAEAILCEFDAKPAGFALFFHNYSTFLGRSGLYLEDLYVKPEYRHQGLGKKILSVLSKIAIDRNCKRMEWSCLNWNKKSIDFYLGLGAQAMKEWTLYRLEGNALVTNAEQIQ